MTISQADIKKLASLSRLKISEEESQQFAKEIDSILGYVEQIKEVSASLEGDSSNKLTKTEGSFGDNLNFLREDVANDNLNPKPEVLVSSAPASQDGLVKVKKILN